MAQCWGLNLVKQPELPEAGVMVFSKSSHCLYFYLFIYLFLAALGLHCCARAFSSCGERGRLFVAVSGLLTAVASLFAEHQVRD